MGKPCTHESLGRKQGKLGGLVVQTPWAKCGDRRQVKRALLIGVTERSGHSYPEKLERRPDRRRMWDIWRRWDVGRTEWRLWDIQIRVERWPDRIPNMRYPGGMRDSRPGEMRDVTCRKGPSTCPRKREPCGTFLGRIPQWVVVQAVLGGCITTKGKTARWVF